MTTAARTTIPEFVVWYRLCNGRGVGIKGCIVGAQASCTVGVLVQSENTPQLQTIQHTPAPRIEDDGFHWVDLQLGIRYTSARTGGVRRAEQHFS